MRKFIKLSDGEKKNLFEHIARLYADAEASAYVNFLVNDLQNIAQKFKRDALKRIIRQEFVAKKELDKLYDYALYQAENVFGYTPQAFQEVQSPLSNYYSIYVEGGKITLTVRNTVDWDTYIMFIGLTNIYYVEEI